MKLRIDRVWKNFNDHGQDLNVLHEISAEVLEGEFVCILGPSGCGKTTLLRLIARLEPPDDGSIYVSEAPTQFPKLEMMFQQPALLPWRSALDNVLLPLELAAENGSSLDIEKWKGRANKLLVQLGLAKFVNYYPFQLSGGMRARVALARALVTGPDILLLDEPFSPLDELTRSSLQDQLLQLVSKNLITVVFVTHSIDEAVSLADRVIIMSRQPGRIVDSIPIRYPRLSYERRDTAITAGLRAHLRDILKRGAR